jgi:hypothetical protein
MLRIRSQLNKNTRFESNLKQVPLVESAETTYHRLAIPTVVSTRREEPKVETSVLNADGATSLLLPQLECLLDKLRHNSVLGSPKPILDRRTGFVEY